MAKSKAYRWRGFGEQTRAPVPVRTRKQQRDPNRRITARYPGQCTACSESIDPGDAILWNSETRKIRHAVCPTRRPPSTTGPSPKMWRHYEAWMTPQQLEDTRAAMAKRVT
jgi:hypothetical protein